MSDEKTPAENPFAKIVARLIRDELQEFEERLLEREDRIAAMVVARLMPTFNEQRLAQLTSEHRINELERKVANLEEIVFRAHADTEPPDAPPGMQS